MTDALGTIDEDGTFTAVQTGRDVTGTLTVTYGETSCTLDSNSQGLCADIACHIKNQ